MFTLMGGIAMFLYGMDLMGKALEQTAGSKLQGILSKMTASPVRGLLLGMVITAVIQSSGATTVMAVGFVNSGLMELHQAIGVIMGANIGTTVTGWLLSPMIAALVMSVSSASVIANALRLNNSRL
mgnify:FL=1